MPTTITAIQAIHYEPRAALDSISPARLKELEPALLAARQEVLDDVRLLRSGVTVPAAKQPLEIGRAHV